MTVLLDGRPEVLVARRDARGVSDRYENKGLEFQHSLRNGFLALAEAEPERIKVINAEGTQDEVQELVLEAVTALLKKVQA
jgi:dTMP kinase